MASASSVKAGRAYVEITMDDSKLVQGMKRAQAKLQSFSTSVTAIGTKLMMIGTAAAAPFAFATKQFADFDDQMRLVQGVTGATDEGLQKLTDTAKELGRTTSYTAAQVAQGMVSLARMGFTVDEINKSIGDFMNLDRATGMNDLGRSAEIGAAAMRSFGLAAKDASRISDVLTATANGSAQTLEDLGEALKMAAPNAHMANSTLEDTCSQLGILANLGIKGSLAGTALAKSFQRLASGKGVEVLEGKGIKTKDANGNLRSMRDILLDIAKVTKNMGSADKIAFLTDVFDVRGAKGGGLIAGNMKDLDAMFQKIEKSAGVAEAIAKKMDSGIGGAFRIFMSAVEGVGLEIGNIIGEYLKPYINTVSTILSKVAEWIKANKDFVIGAVKIVAAILAAGAALITLGITIKVIAVAIGGLAILFKALYVAIMIPVVAMKAMIAVVGLLKAAFIAMQGVVITFAAIKTAVLALWNAILLSPVTALIAFAAGVAAIFYVVQELTGAFDGLLASFREFGAGCTAAFGTIVEVAKQSYEAIKIALGAGDLAGAAKVGLAALKVVWLAGLMPLEKAWQELKLFLLDAWTFCSYSLLKGASNLWYGLLIGLKQIGVGIANTWDAIWGGIIGAFEATIGYLKKKWIQFKGFFDSDVNVEAEIAKVDAEIAENKSERAKRSNDAVNRRNGEIDALKTERDQFGNAIDQSMYDEMNQHQQSYNQAMADAAKGLADAKNDWQTAVDDVKKRAAERAAKVENVSDETAKTEAKLGITGDKAIGSWNLNELNAALGNNTAADRTAAATEQSVALQEKTNKKLDKVIANGSGSTKLAYT